VAHYLVRATIWPQHVAELADQLGQRAFLSIQPFGSSLTAGLEGARWESEGVAVWEEEDYCSPPLAMERAAVLDEYFADLRVEAVERGEGWKRIRELPRVFTSLPTASSG
jgi:hypothetical protein